MPSRSDQVRPSAAGLVIEFWGRAGAGKTTLAGLTVEHLRQRDLSVVDATESRSRLWIHLERTLGAVACMARYPRESAAATRYVKASAQRTRSNFRAVLTKWLAKYNRFRSSHRMGGMVVTDEGVMQALWSMHYSATRRTPAALLQSLAVALPARWLLVEIEMADDLWRQRLLKRQWRPNRLTVAVSADPERATTQAHIATEVTRDYVTALERSYPATVAVLRVENGMVDPHILAARIADHATTLATAATGPPAARVRG